MALTSDEPWVTEPANESNNGIIIHQDLLMNLPKKQLSSRKKPPTENRRENAQDSTSQNKLPQLCCHGDFLQYSSISFN